MSNYFQCSIRYEKTMENGSNKKVTEKYLVDALSFTEAEARIIEKMRAFISGEFSVSAIVPCSYDEVIFSDDMSHDRYWAIKIAYFVLDEKTGTEKISNNTFLVQADTVDTANQRARDFLKDTMLDYRIVGSKETKLMDVYKYNNTDQS